MNIPGMTLTWPWNWNHTYTFYANDGVTPPRRLINVRFSEGDQSVYMMPLYEREFVVQSFGKDGKKAKQFTHRPGGDFHLSMHDSGIVNLTTSEGEARLVREVRERKGARHVATFQINSTDNFPVASLDEIENPKGKHMNLPLLGSPIAPRMLTVYSVKESANWLLPSLGNSAIIDYKSIMRGKDYNFHFVLWQNQQMPKGDGDIAMWFGGEGVA